MKAYKIYPVNEKVRVIVRPIDCGLDIQTQKKKWFGWVDGQKIEINIGPAIPEESFPRPSLSRTTANHHPWAWHTEHWPMNKFDLDTRVHKYIQDEFIDPHIRRSEINQFIQHTIDTIGQAPCSCAHCSL